MTILLFFILVGFTLLIFLYFLLTRSSASTAEGSAQSLQAAHHTIARLQQSLLSTRIVEAIFSESDLTFVQQSGSSDISHLFFSERRRIALLWVSEIRAQIICLSRFHRAQSGFYSDFSFSSEFSMVSGFWSLLLACRALQILIYFRGPFAARAIAIRTIETAGRLCQLAGQPIAFLDSYSVGMSGTRLHGSRAGK